MAEPTGSENKKEKEFLLHNFFPDLNDDKINTVKFLEASRGIVALIDKFGKMFALVSSDISGNINKIQQSYNTNPKQYTFIEDLILSEKDLNGVAVDALLWLQRALHFVLLFFVAIVTDIEKTECLEKHMTLAYIQALKPHHGWLSRSLFRCFPRILPKRSVLLSAIAENKKDDDEIIKDLEIYIKNLEINVNHIIEFYKESELSTDSKAP